MIYTVIKMKKIVDVEICDLVPFSKGIIFAVICEKKEMLSKSRCKVSFYGCDLQSGRRARVSKAGYQYNKFGNAFKAICAELGDYVSCDAAVLPNGDVAVVYPSGETGMFGSSGAGKWTADLLYHGSPVRDVAAHENDLWCAVPEQNAVISYSVPHKKFSMRIGGSASPTFDCPVSLSLYGGELFVCCVGSCKIRAVDLRDFSVRDFRQFDEPVRRYLHVGSNEVFWLESGVYVM